MEASAAVCCGWQEMNDGNLSQHSLHLCWISDPDAPSGQQEKEMTREEAIKFIMNKNNVSRAVASVFVDTNLRLA